MLNPKYLIIHTTAFDGPNCDAAMVDGWHRARGWRKIGYHFVILNHRCADKPDGAIETGRALAEIGAHAQGLNQRSIGICCVGRGDIEPLTSAQGTSLINLLSQLRIQFPAIKTQHILGHNEMNQLIERGELQPRFRTAKSCPGRFIDMDAIRNHIAAS